jgi:hypothetical protein
MLSSLFLGHPPQPHVIPALPAIVLVRLIVQADPTTLSLHKSSVDVSPGLSFIKFPLFVSTLAVKFIYSLIMKLPAFYPFLEFCW